MLVGYARTANGEDSLESRVKVLKQAGCQRIFVDKSYESKFDQPALTAALASMLPEDTLIIERLDQLGRSLRKVLQKVGDLEQRGIRLRSIQEEIDTAPPDGLHQMRVFAALAQCDRNLIRERTAVGLTAARARGRKGGRPKGLSPKAQQTASVATRLYMDGELSIQEICDQLQISKPTLYSYLRFRGVEIGRR